MCVFAERLDVENMAFPPLIAPVPSATKLTLHGAGEQVSSENVTVPVAAAGETVAAKVTVCPAVDGFELDESATVVGVLFTVCTRVDEDPPKVLSPLYVADIKWVPAAKEEVENAATPPFRVPAPIWVVPSENVTDPVAAVGLTVAVNVMDWPTTDGLTLEVTFVTVIMPDVRHAFSAALTYSGTDT